MQSSEKYATLFSIVILGFILGLLYFSPVSIMRSHAPRPNEQQEMVMMAVLEAMQAMPVDETVAPSKDALLQPEPEQSPPAELSQNVITEYTQPVVVQKKIEPPPKIVKKETAVKPSIQPSTSHNVVVAHSIEETVSAVNPSPITSSVIPSNTLINSVTFVQDKPVEHISLHSSPNMMAQYRDIILSTLAQHKDYPQFSRRLGEEGSCLVSFTVQRSGLITNLHLISSSGFERLDQATLAIFETLHMHFPPFFSEMPEPSLHFELPIIYALQ